MKKYLPIIIAIIVAGAIGFFIGKGSAAPSQAGTGTRGAYSGLRSGASSTIGGGRGAGLNGGFTAGQIISQSGNSVTVKLSSGGSKIVIFSSSTEIMKSVSGTPSDLAIGDQITVSGSANSDGSVTAQTIQLRPAPPAGAGTSTN